MPKAFCFRFVLGSASSHSLAVGFSFLVPADVLSVVWKGAFGRLVLILFPGDRRCPVSLVCTLRIA